MAGQRTNRKSRKNRREKVSTKNDRLIKIGLVVAGIVLIYIIYRIFDAVVLQNETYDLSGETYYQYFYGIKEQYSGNMEVLQNDDSIQLILKDNDNKVIYLDSTPIYYENILGKVLFAPEMELVMPDAGNYKLSKFTNIIHENRTMYVKKFNKDEKTALENAFLFDGNNLYFFLEETTITVGETEYTVSPLSYALVNYRQSVEIYDYNTNEYTIIQDEETLTADVLATNTARNYTINMSVDSLTTEKSNQLLLTNINNLTEFSY